MTLGEALFIAREIVEEAATNISDNRIYETAEVLRYAVDNNLEELIEDAIRKLRYSSKVGDQNLADSLEEILEGITE